MQLVQRRKEYGRVIHQAVLNKPRFMQSIGGADTGSQASNVMKKSITMVKLQKHQQSDDTSDQLLVDAIKQKLNL